MSETTGLRGIELFEVYAGYRHTKAISSACPYSAYKSLPGQFIVCWPYEQRDDPYLPYSPIRV